MRVAALPADFRLAFSVDVKELSHGRRRVVAGGDGRAAGALLGGDPLRLLRLTAAGMQVVHRLRGGERVADAGPGAGALARRLVQHGFADPIPGAAGRPSPGEVTVAIPVRDRAAALRDLLATLDPRLAIVVVDDGSLDGSGDVARERGATVVQHARPLGPAAARNSALAVIRTPYVAFVDSDCRPRPGWLDPLLAAMADPVVAMAAPRIRSTTGESVLERYESDRSPHDMGERPAQVRAGGRVPYVPSAALLVRRAAVTGRQDGAARCFDTRLRMGEDVDLVWRLADAGWGVRYVPESLVEHAPRTGLRGWCVQRYGYGTSAAPLEARHPGTLRPLRGSGLAALAWGAVAAGRPAVGSALLGAATGRLAARLGSAPGGPLLAAALVAGSQRWIARQLATTITRGWLPLLLASRRGRRLVVAAAVLPPAVDWWRRRPAVPLPAYLGLRLADDAAYCAGVWAGCLRERTLRPLLPALGSGEVDERFAPLRRSTGERTLHASPRFRL